MHSYFVYHLYGAAVGLCKPANMVCEGSLRLLHACKNISLLMGVQCTELQRLLLALALRASTYNQRDASDILFFSACMVSWHGVLPTLLLRVRTCNLIAWGGLSAGVQPRVPIPSMYCTMFLGLIGGTLLAHQQSWGVHFLPSLGKE